MIFGRSTTTYTFLHLLISLIGIGSGVVVMYGFLTGRRLDDVLTSVTGFGFPFEHLLPSHKVGIISLVTLALAIPARNVFHLAGSWRRIYVVSATAALYLNVFVLIAQASMKVPALTVLAPTGQEPPFLVAQLLVLLVFVGLTIRAAKRFHIEPGRAV